MYFIDVLFYNDYSVIYWYEICAGPEKGEPTWELRQQQ
jgi:hypothetical protein